MQAALLPIHSPPRAERTMPPDSNTAGSEESDQKEAFQDVLSAEESDAGDSRAPNEGEDTSAPTQGATSADAPTDEDVPEKRAGLATGDLELPLGGSARALQAKQEAGPTANPDPTMRMGTTAWPLRSGLHVTGSGEAAAAAANSGTQDPDVLPAQKSGQADPSGRPIPAVAQSAVSALEPGGKPLEARSSDLQAQGGKLPAANASGTNSAGNPVPAQSIAQISPGAEALRSLNPAAAQREMHADSRADETATLRNFAGSKEQAAPAAAKTSAAPVMMATNVAQATASGTTIADLEAATAIGNSDTGDSGRSADADSFAATVSGSERGDTTRSAQLRPELMRADTARAVGRQMIEQVQAGRNGSFEISLNPEELGRIRMTLTPSEQGLHLSLSGERSETLDLLRRHISELQQDFAELGYGDISFEFGDGDGTDSSGEGQSFAQTGADAPSGPVQLVDPQTTGAAANAGLDLRL